MQGVESYSIEKSSGTEEILDTVDPAYKSSTNLTEDKTNNRLMIPKFKSEIVGLTPLQTKDSARERHLKLLKLAQMRGR